MSYSAFQASVTSGSLSNAAEQEYMASRCLEDATTRAAQQARLDATRGALEIVQTAPDLACARAVLMAQVTALEGLARSV